MRFNTTQYTTPGNYTWDVPQNVHWVWVNGTAGGGGGGSTATDISWDGTGGGGAGEIVEGVQIKVTPGGTLAITIGTGGEPTPYTEFGSGAGHLGPDNTQGGGDQGGDTIVGPIRLVGGYGGISNHGGCGGGTNAYWGNASGFGRGNMGDCPPVSDGSAGVSAQQKNAPRFWSGSGGGSSSLLPGSWSGNDGGGMIGNAGGIGGSGADPYFGSGGGSASFYGPGGDGGNAGVDGDEIGHSPPATAYGAGGGGQGENSSGDSGAPLLPAAGGGAGRGGYVALFWFE